ncbi:MAG: hypothetical protein HY066_16390 [Betaproteobacteria bacterium]|nr:hypothetical protein [Betaproteobacteria bacterium]
MVTTFAGKRGPGNYDFTGTAATFNNPQAVVTDAAGNIYVADGASIRKIMSTGEAITLAGTVWTRDSTVVTSGSIDGLGAEAKFSGSNMGLATDSVGNVYVEITHFTFPSAPGLHR